jgi:hypothetical protein
VPNAPGGGELKRAAVHPVDHPHVVLADLDAFDRDGFEVPLRRPVRVVESISNTLAKRLQFADDLAHFPELQLEPFLDLSLCSGLLEMKARLTNPRLELLLLNQAVAVGVNQLADLALHTARLHLERSLARRASGLIAEVQPSLVFFLDAMGSAKSTDTSAHIARLPVSARAATDCGIRAVGSCDAPRFQHT